MKCELFMLQIHHNKKGKDTEHILAEIVFLFQFHLTNDASISVFGKVLC